MDKQLISHSIALPNYAPITNSAVKYAALICLLKSFET
jgi:hypothetical protein